MESNKNYAFKKYFLNRWVFRATLNLCTSEILRIIWGSSFQREAPACVKERSPHRVWVLGTTSENELEDRRFLDGWYWTNRLVLYSGAEPCKQWKTSKSNLVNVQSIRQGVMAEWFRASNSISGSWVIRVWVRVLEQDTLLPMLLLMENGYHSVDCVFWKGGGGRGWTPRPNYESRAKLE